MRFDICIMRSQRFLFERQIRSFSYGSIERLLSFLRVARKTISHVTINVKKLPYSDLYELELGISFPPILHYANGKQLASFF